MTRSEPFKYTAEFLPRLQCVTISIETHSSGYIPIQAECTSPTTCSVGFTDLTSNTQVSLSMTLPHPIKKVVLLNLLRKHPLCDTLYTAKLPAAAIDTKYYDRSANFSMAMAGEHVRWSTKEIKGKVSSSSTADRFSFDCSQCHAPIIADTKVTAFHDLPSELWQEMMDYWHCHKPETGHSHGTTRYTTLRPRAGGVIIGPYYLLTNADDFPTIALSGNEARCAGCAHVLGSINPELLVRLFKWNLSLRTGSRKESYLPYWHAYGVMLDAINSQASRVYQMKNESDSQELLVWVLNVGVDVCVQLRQMANCLKVLYMNPGRAYEAEMERRGDALEGIVLSDAVYHSMVQELEAITLVLPQTQAHFAEWTVGYLTITT